MKAVAHIRHIRSDDANAFLPDPFEHGRLQHQPPTDELAEELAEEFVSAATSGEDCATDARAELTSEELGGPFVVTRAQTEFGATVNELEPLASDREAFPTTGGATSDSTNVVRAQVKRQGS